MDDRKSSKSNSANATAPRFFQRRDGSYAAVFVDDNGWDTIAKLVVIPSPTAIDKFDDEVGRARKVLQSGIDAGVVDDALALFDYRYGAALQALRKALKP